MPTREPPKLQSAARPCAGTRFAHPQTHVRLRDPAGDGVHHSSESGVSTHVGGGGVHGSASQFAPDRSAPGGVHDAECQPGGQVPASPIAWQGGATPPQQGCSQYWVTPQICVPQAKGAFAGGGVASLPASSLGAGHGISSTATDHADPVHVAIEGPPSEHP
jgi:hypothetical protein